MNIYLFLGVIIGLSLPVLCNKIVKIYDWYQDLHRIRFDINELEKQKKRYELDIRSLDSNRAKIFNSISYILHRKDENSRELQELEARKEKLSQEIYDLENQVFDLKLKIGE